MMPATNALPKPSAASSAVKPWRAATPAGRLTAVPPPVLQPLRAPRQLCLDLQPRLR
jgi:hypothetical protein